MKFLRASISSFFQSIRFRITLWFVLILAIVLAAFSVFILFTQYRDYQFDAIGNMQEKLARLQTYFRSAEWQNSNLSPTDVPNNQAPLQTGDLIILTDINGLVLQNWGANPADPDGLVGSLLPAATQNQDTRVYQQTIPILNNKDKVNTDYLFIIVPVIRGDALLGFLVLGSPSPLADHLRRLAFSLLMGSLGMLVVAFLGGLWLADRAMRPVKAITNAAHTISESDLSRRLNLQGHDELAQLASTFDEMLNRLQAAFERQRQFLADASHELRTPLTVMNLEVGRVLSGHRTSSEYQHALQTVDAESSRMTRLVNELMALARMDAGQASIKLEDLDLSDVTVEAVERMSPLAERQNIVLELGEMPELSINGDRHYLIQMISNLIENGIKYSGSGQKVRIENRLVRINNKNLASLRVTDTGPGIAQEYLPHIFDRFYRVDSARSRDNNEDSDSPTGSGLGLSIVAWITRVHDGEIHVTSTMGQGSTFEVTLPIKH
jgi:signal transduction histidine kinase